MARGARIDQIDKALLATASALDVVLIVVGIPGQLADDRVEARAPDSRVGGEVTRRTVLWRTYGAWRAGGWVA